MKLTKLALACALTGSLAACGGGGSDAVQIDRTLSGVAAKGLIKNGVVNVYSYSTGKKSKSIATTTTDSEGRYSVKIGSNTGVLTIEVSAGANTTMADEVSGDIPMPDMTLRSAINLNNDALTTVTSYVTPLTDMLVKSAESADGGLTSNNFDDARIGVTKMMGFNPLETKPINVDNPAAVADMDPAEQKQSLYLAAISKLANDDTNNLECAGTVSEKTACVVNKISDSATMVAATPDKEATWGLTSIVKDEIITARDAVISDSSLNKTEIISPDGQADLSPVTVPTSGVVNSITAAKALFASLRSNINAWSAAAKTGGALNNQAEALKADFDTAIAPLDKDLADWILISGRGIAFFNKFKDGTNSVNSAPIFRSDEQSYYDPSTQQYESYQQPIGYCSVYADAAANTTLATTPTEAKSVFCSLNHTDVSSTWDQVTGDETYTGFTKTILLTPGAGSTPSFSYESRARMETWKFTSSTGVSTRLSKDTIGAHGTTDRANGTVSYTMSGNIVTGATINGFMPARTDDMGVAITDQESWNVSYVRTPEAGDVNKYALSGDITALKGGVAVGSVALQDGSYIRAVSAVDDTIAKHGVTDVNLVLAVAAGKSKVTGTLSLSNFSADKNGSNYIPTDLKFIGSFTNASSEFFNGTLTAKTSNYVAYDNSLPRSTTNFAPTSGSFVGILRIPARPDLKLTLSADNSALDVADFSAQYDDGTNTVLIDSTNAKPKVVNISSASGVSMQLKEDVNTADVMRNSSKIAVFNRSTGMIDYEDGTFESLK